jgi:hypothetical protein
LREIKNLSAIRLWKIWRPEDMNKYYNEVCGEFNKYDEVIIEGTLLYLNEETEKVLVSDLEFSRDNLLLIEHTI